MEIVRYTAAGGVVAHNGKVLLLNRPARNEIRLPKGHVEAGETLAEAALREVSEESGYIDLEIVADLGQQTVEFDVEERHVVRDEHYFLMRLAGERQIKRDPHEDQFIPFWLAWDEAAARLTYPAEQEWLRRAGEKFMSGLG